VAIHAEWCGGESNDHRSVVLEILQHLNHWLAALHMSLVNNHKLKAIESPVSLRTLAAGEQRLLAGHHNLCGPVVALSNEVSHLNVWVCVGDLPHLVGGLPDKLTHGGDDQRPAFDAVGQRGEYDRLASAGEQADQCGSNASGLRIQQRLNHFRLIVT
jgi:hypothetical protein